MNAQPLRIAGVPEAFNDTFECIKPDVATFLPHPGGSGAMIANLVDEKVDAAFVLTEAVVSAICRGNQHVGIVAPVVASSLVWGVIARTGTKPSIDEPWAVSRHGSGSDVMLKVWAKENAPPVKTCGNFDAMCDAVLSQDASAFLWEKSTTRGLLRKKGEDGLAIVNQVEAPWPAFCCVARKDSKVLTQIREFVKLFVTEAVRWKSHQETPLKISVKYGMTEEEAREWLLNVAFAKPDDVVDLDMLSTTAQKLAQAGVLKETIDKSTFLVAG